MKRFQLQFRLFAAILLTLASWQGVAAQPAPIMPGDINFDRVIDVGDVNVIIDKILGRLDLDAKAFDNADLTHDGIIDVSDANALIDLILGKGYVHADPRTLVVAMRDGSVHSFPLADKPEVSFVDDEMLVKSETETNYFGRNQLYQVYYNLDASGAQRHARLKEPVADNPNQYAVYIYRNDNDFNAHMNIDIESIRFSAVGTDSVWYDTPVVQEVWTPDSVYRTPLAVVDSLTFQAPKPKLKDELYIVNESNVGYVTYTDDNTIRFMAATPASLLPALGQPIVSELFCEPVSDGFAGRAVSSSTLSTGEIEYRCDDITFDDIFDELVLVAKATNDTHVPGQRVRPRRLFGLDNPNGEIITLDDVFPEVTLGYDNFPVSLKYHPIVTIDYVLYVQRHEPTHIRLVISGDHTITPQLSLEQSLGEIKKTAWLHHEAGDWTKSKPIKVPIGHGFKLTWNLGLFYKLAGKIALNGKMPVTIHHALGFDYHGKEFDLNNLKFIHDFGIDFGVPSLNLSLKGSASAGIAAELGVAFIHNKLAGITGTLNVGPKLSASLDLSAQGIIDDSYYTLLKDTKIKGDFNIGLDFDYTLLNKKYKMTPGQGWPGVKKGDPIEGKWDLSFEWDIPMREWKLFPSFTTPVVKNYESGVVTLSTTPTDNLFLPVYVGMGLYNSQNELVGQRTGTSDDYWYWGKSQSTPRQFTFSGLTPSEQYTCRPIVTFFGDNLKAEPPKTFTATELKTPGQVYVGVGQERTVHFEGCSGVYKLNNKSADLVKTTLEGNSFKLQGLKAGDATLELTDKETGEKQTILVTVGDVQGNLALSTDNVQVAVGSEATVSITSGSGNYGVASDHPQIATAYVHKTNGPSGGDHGLDAPRRTPGADGYDEVVITGKSAGTAVVTVTDTKTGQTADINVTVGNEQVQTQTFTVNGVSFKMVAVEGGTFMMGASDDDTEAESHERPAHQVTLSSFAIGETEVTQELWQAVMGNNPSFFNGNQTLNQHEYDFGINLQRPVENVSWNDCQEFITKLNALTGKTFRLPTEAEWEYAARGGNRSLGYKYAGSNNIDEVAWYSDNSFYDTTRRSHTVGTKQPSELGLYDMSGNVYEWCSDYFGDYSSEAQINPTGPASGSRRVVRGGCWGLSARNCRVSFRDSNPSGYLYRYSLLGLRLAL